MSDRARLLNQTAALAADFLAGLAHRPVRATATRDELIATLGGPLPDHGDAPGEVIADLAREAGPGLVASAGPRYFGFVIGGHHPAALAADWLTAAWDQNLGLYVGGPSLTVVEETAGAWMLDVLGLPAGASFGFVTGATIANFVGLAAARGAVHMRSAIGGTRIVDMLSGEQVPRIC